ncbi:MAG TPA: hypothetical protein VMV18_01415 [bacterium]|nr:hypothetical protein [bacterium]
MGGRKRSAARAKTRAAAKGKGAPKRRGTAAARKRPAPGAPAPAAPAPARPRPPMESVVVRTVAGESRREPPKFELGVDPEKIDEAITNLRKQVEKFIRRGFADKIRIKYKGKPLGPDIPVAYFLAAEGLAFWSAGILRVLLVNLGARALLTVELISSAVEHHAKGVERYMAGDVDGALAHFERAVESDEYHAASQRMLGTVLKLKGNLTGARVHLARAIELDPDGEDGRKARELLSEL